MLGGSRCREHAWHLSGSPDYASCARQWRRLLGQDCGDWAIVLGRVAFESLGAFRASQLWKAESDSTRLRLLSLIPSVMSNSLGANQPDDSALMRLFERRLRDWHSYDDVERSQDEPLPLYVIALLPSSSTSQARTRSAQAREQQTSLDRRLEEIAGAELPGLARTIVTRGWPTSVVLDGLRPSYLGSRSRAELRAIVRELKGLETRRQADALMESLVRAWMSERKDGPFGLNPIG